jgi:hypothetical protein
LRPDFFVNRVTLESKWVYKNFKLQLKKINAEGLLMKFRKWLIAFGTPTELGAKLKVTEATVRGWIKGNALPRGITMQHLVKMGKGAFDYKDIVTECSGK